MSYRLQMLGCSAWRDGVALHGKTISGTTQIGDTYVLSFTDGTELECKAILVPSGRMGEWRVAIETRLVEGGRG